MCQSAEPIVLNMLQKWARLVHPIELNCHSILIIIVGYEAISFFCRWASLSLSLHFYSLAQLFIVCHIRQNSGRVFTLRKPVEKHTKPFYLLAILLLHLPFIILLTLIHISYSMDRRRENLSCVNRKVKSCLKIVTQNSIPFFFISNMYIRHPSIIFISKHQTNHIKYG